MLSMVSYEKISSEKSSRTSSVRRNRPIRCHRSFAYNGYPHSCGYAAVRQAVADENAVNPST